jgi:hypothetical protein
MLYEQHATSPILGIRETFDLFPTQRGKKIWEKIDFVINKMLLKISRKQL